MGVLLFILKWIGIVLLCIVSLFLLILLVSLTVPLRYSGKGSYEHQFRGQFYVTWLMRFISVRADVTGSKVELTVRILGFRIFSFPETEAMKAKKLRKQHKSKYKPHKTSLDEEADEPDELFEADNSYDDGPLEPDETVDKPIDAHASAKDFKNKEINIEEPEHDKQETHSKKGNRRSFSFPHPIQWLRDVRHRCTMSFRKLKKSLRSMLNRISEVKLFLQDEKNKASFKKIKRTIFDAVWYVLPRRKRIDCRFGTGDPALTGQIMGLFAVFYPKYYKDTTIIPDFENRTFEGHFWFKGRIRGIHFVIALIKLWCDKNIRLLFKKYVITR